MTDIDALIVKHSKIELGKLQKDYTKPILWKIMIVSVIAETILYYSLKSVNGGWAIVLFYLSLFFLAGIGFFLLPLIVRFLLPIIINIIKIVFAIPEMIKLLLMLILSTTTEYLEGKLFDND